MCPARTIQFLTLANVPALHSAPAAHRYVLPEAFPLGLERDGSVVFIEMGGGLCVSSPRRVFAWGANYAASMTCHPRDTALLVTAV